MIDSHAHLTSETVLPGVEAVLERAKKLGIKNVVNICTDPKSLQEGLRLAKKHPWISNAAATTPHDVETEGDLFFPLVEVAARERLLVAIGETGLDYHYEHSNRLTQKLFLSRYFQLAKSCQLPLIFHCREAFDDLFAFADVEYNNSPALLHCFTGTLAEAKGVLDRGWYLSLSGIITFKKSESLREVAKYVPLDRLLVETDTPYLAPQSRRGEQNEPSFLLETIEMIAKVKGEEVDLVARMTAENASRFFTNLACQ